jgi:hypothetical protein
LIKRGIFLPMSVTVRTEIFVAMRAPQITAIIIILIYVSNLNSLLGFDRVPASGMGK